MKTALVSVLTATVLGLASNVSGRTFDAADFTAIMFATGLVAWTIDQYSRRPRVLAVSRTIQFPVKLAARPAPAGRMAA
jgi:hypothetical protein